MKQKSVGLTLRALILALVLSLVAGTPALPPLDGVAYAQSSGLGLTATVAPDGSSVSLSWNAVTGADSYEIWRGPVVNNNAQWGTSAYATVQAPTVTYTDSNVTAGTTYAYGVRSVTGGTPGGWDGNYPNVAIPGGTAAPTASPSVTVAADGTTAVDVSWTTVSGATGYYVQFWHAGLDDWERISGNQTSPYKHTGLTPGTEYYYVVAAFNAGGMGPWSSWRTDDSKVTLQATTDVPKLTLTRIDRTTVQLDWTPTAADARYDLERRKIHVDPGADATITTDDETMTGDWGRLPSDLLSVTTYTDSGANFVPNNAFTVKYEYRVQAIDSQGTKGAWSDVKSVNVPRPGATLGAPGGFSVSTISDSSIQISWNAVTGADFYELMWKSGDRNYETRRVDATFYDDTGLSPSTKYTYKVRAVDVNGPGDETGEKSATTRATPTAAGQMPKVTGLTVTDATADNKVNTRKARLTWNAVSDATHYEIQRFSPATGVWAALGAGASEGTTDGTVTRVTKAAAGSPPTLDDTFTTAAGSDPPNSPAQTYFYVVSAVNHGVDGAVGAAETNADNEMGEWSDYKSISFKDYKPGTPSGLTFSQTSGTSIRVSWTAAARGDYAAGPPVVAGIGSPGSYTLQWRTSETATWNNLTVGGTSHHHTGLNGNSTYFYRVRAENSGGESGWTDSYSWQLGNTLTPPSGLQAVDATGDDDVPKIKLTWNAVSGASGYEVQRFGALFDHDGDGGTTPEIAVWGDLDGAPNTDTDRTPANVTDDSLDDGTTPTNLSANTTYLYRVRTVKENSRSGWSVVASGTTRRATANAPTLVATTTGQSMIRLSWTPVGGATAYHLEFLEGTHADAIFASSVVRDKRTISGNHRHYVHSGLKAGTRYSYRLRAALPEGAYSQWTTAATTGEEVVQPYTSPAKPELSVKTTTATAITLKWAPVAFVDDDGSAGKLVAAGNYQVQRRESGSSDWVNVIAGTGVTNEAGTNEVSCNAAETECTLVDNGFDGDDTDTDDDGLKPKTRYYYRIRATIERSVNSNSDANVTAANVTYTSYWDYTNQTTPAK